MIGVLTDGASGRATEWTLRKHGRHGWHESSALCSSFVPQSWLTIVSGKPPSRSASACARSASVRSNCEVTSMQQRTLTVWRLIRENRHGEQKMQCLLLDGGAETEQSIVSHRSRSL